MSSACGPAFIASPVSHPKQLLRVELCSGFGGFGAAQITDYMSSRRAFQHSHHVAYRNGNSHFGSTSALLRFPMTFPS